MQLVRYYLILIILLSNCGSRTQELRTNSTIQEVFNTIEINNLNKILTFFENEICSDLTEVTEINKCYINFFSTLRSAVKDGEFPININFEKQREMYSELSDSTFMNIWTINKSFKFKSKDTLQSIVYLYDGKFAKLLEATGKDYPMIKGYSETFKETGDITPSLTANFIINYSKLNLNDPRIKMIVAVHYLTLNDQYLRNEAY